MTTCILTILKAAENEKYNNFFETFNLHGPKCPNFRKILPHVLDLKMLPNLRNNQQLVYHSLWNTLYDNPFHAKINTCNDLFYSDYSKGGNHWKSQSQTCLFLPFCFPCNLSPLIFFLSFKSEFTFIWYKLLRK